MIPIVKYTFNTVPVGTAAANAVPIANWATYGQGGTASESIVAGAETNRMRVQNENGLWVTCFGLAQTYTECDFTAFINAANVYISPRGTVDSAIVPTGFSSNIVPSTGAVTLQKNCAGAGFTLASTTIAPFSDEFKARITIVGFAVNIYINDVFVLSYDFDGNGLCGTNGPSSGYPCVTTFNQIITFDSGDKTPNYVLMTGV
jgi:hypothetical protein